MIFECKQLHIAFEERNGTMAKILYLMMIDANKKTDKA